MRLYVYILEARDLPVKSSYVKLQVGKFKAKTRVVRNCSNNGLSDPIWNEEFVFRVHDMNDELIVSVYHREEDSRLFNVSGFLIGRVRLPVSSIAALENQSVQPTWFSLEKPKSGKYIKNNRGKVLLTISLHAKEDELSRSHVSHALPVIDNSNDKKRGNPDGASKEGDSSKSFNSSPSSPKIPHGKKLIKAFAHHFEKLLHKNGDSHVIEESSDISCPSSEYEDHMEEPFSSSSFEAAIEAAINSPDIEQEMPVNLEGGVLHDQTYVVPPRYLNAFLFAPDSQFRKNLAELQGIMDMEEGPWMWKSEDLPFLTRTVTYTQPPSKLVKAVKATENQTYVKAENGEFAVRVDVYTPDVPYGNNFRVQLLYKILHGPELSAGEETSHLTISWGIKFQQSTMMRSMIEGGAQKGLKESFDQFARLLAQSLKVMKSSESLDKNQVMETLQREHHSDWELAVEYFGNLTVVFTAFMVLYITVHILLCKPSIPQGLEFDGFDLPDSFGELVTSGILFIMLERVYSMVSHFVEARLSMGSDHGIKSQGAGWVVTVALVEAVNLPSVDFTGGIDPFVILTCNGKTRTSSVQLQTCDPQWNEMLEFDATEEPPSVLDVEVFDFDGPFDLAASLGHAEINFLKHTSTELADIWIPLEGKLAISSQAKLHLRIFLENNKGAETIRGYLTKMEKEVGKKLNLRSPQKNSSFQKTFGLPPEEFLIKDYSCYLRRKMPLQGRLFLSARIVGFYANFFGQKTKFFFLWEDIEDIEVQAPSLASVWSPILVIILRKGKGQDAKHGAKSQDDEGRLRFYFQSFASFEVSSRTIIALWKARTLPADQKALITEEELDLNSQLVPIENERSHLAVVDIDMLKMCSAEIPVDVESMMKMFDGGALEHKVMAKSGCVNFTTTPWEEVKHDLFERRVSYRLNHNVSIFGGEVKCIQRKSPIEDVRGWVINEVMTLHDIPFCDHFHLHLKYEIQEMELDDDEDDIECRCVVYLGIEWLKSGKFQYRITRNINEKFATRLKKLFELVKKEMLAVSDQTLQ